MIQPVKKDDDLLREIIQTDPGEGIALWWLGQSGFLVKSADRTFLLDPYLSDSLTRKYAGTDTPHERMTEICVDPGRLTADLVTSSHAHTDHLDAETLLPLIEANPSLTLVIPEAIRDRVAERLGIERDRPVGVIGGCWQWIEGLEIYGVPSAHETLEYDEAGRSLSMGYVIRAGRITLYHPGDTVVYEGLAETLRPLRIDVALLPINGRPPGLSVAGNMDGEEAAGLAKSIGAKLVVPCHYEMFQFNTASPDEFAAACERFGQPYQVMKCAERLIVGP